LAEVWALLNAIGVHHTMVNKVRNRRRNKSVWMDTQCLNCVIVQQPANECRLRTFTPLSAAVSKTFEGSTVVFVDPGTNVDISYYWTRVLGDSGKVCCRVRSLEMDSAAGRRAIAHCSKQYIYTVSGA